ncbi:MAG: hypothetical protein AAF938_06755 [Myxococcota bacterium]
MKKTRVFWVAALAATMACGDDDGPSDMGGEDMADAAMEAGGEMSTTMGCGDGVLQVDERCDTAIAAGEEGACPTECPMSDDACMPSVVRGAGCFAECAVTPIETAADDDGCCLPDNVFADDNDCLPEGCGNGTVDLGEFCDVAIAAGEEGACPTSCEDGIACTEDRLVDGGSCRAVCQFPVIEAPMNGDGCCPSGATFDEDDDCSATCGNGSVDDGETCDTAIAAGEDGACPTGCSSVDICAPLTLDSEDTCSAFCRAEPITRPLDGDRCCPDGADATSDSDCTPECGNGIREPGEGCDDGNDVDDDLCSNTCTNLAEVTAFRVTELSIVDPAIYLGLTASICVDVTEPSNTILQQNVDSFSLNALMTFRPYDSEGPSTPVDVYLQAPCEEGSPLDRCNTSRIVQPSTAFNQPAGGTCYTPNPAYRNPDYGPLNDPAGPCFIAATREVSFLLAGAEVRLTDVSVSATYMDDDRLVNGVIEGFLTFEDAREINVDLSDLGAGMPTVFELLQSELDGDACDAPDVTTTDADDRAGEGVADGWWFYLNVSAELIELVGA